ncbi:MAG: HAMP domain-containing sensor histidine kinase [Actinomycetota bacterium]|nr:HAMP domain-containing sensor histidine kinase [Actinomycetota bacterium]
MSLRTRLLLAVGAVLLLALAATDLIVSAELRASLFRQVDASLAAAQSAIAQPLAHRSAGDGETRDPDGGRPNDHDRDDRLAAGALQAGVLLPATSAPVAVANPQPSVPNFCDQVGLAVAPGAFVELRSASGTPVAGYVCPAHVDDVSYTPKLPARLSGLRSPASDGSPRITYFTADSTSASGPEFRVSAARLPPGAPGAELIVASQLGNVQHTLDQLTSIELVVSGAALVIGTLLGWLLVHLDLRPLRDIERTAGAIAGGDLESRVPGANQRTEVGHVASALNLMLGRIEEAFAARDATEAELRESEERLRRFVGDASHELRTPIAAVSAYAELFHQGAANRPDDLQRAMTGIRSETARMSHLVEDLLLLARLDEGRPLERQLIELVGLSAEAIETARTVGPDWPIRLSASEPVELLGDALRLRQVLDNLLANVRAHTSAGTEVAVQVRREGPNAVLEVADNGPGMAPADAAKVFDRFYRADKSRSRARGGSGLGLAIVASIVAAHEGSVHVTSELGAGTTFTVVLPRALGELDHEAAAGPGASEVTDGPASKDRVAPADAARRVDDGPERGAAGRPGGAAGPSRGRPGAQ